MVIIRASVLGYCFGVKRAVEEASKALEVSKGDCDVYTLGPLIHNPLVLQKLEDKGLKVLSEKDIPYIKDDSVVIIRAHGTTPDIVDSLQRRNIKIIDCTCPKVHLSQKRAYKDSSNGYKIIIAGDKNHGEVIGIEGYSCRDCDVIQTSDQASRIELADKNVLIVQTTFSIREFEAISSVLKSRCQKISCELVIYNSICSATMERQKALDELEGKTDGIIVIGGKNSANTLRLYEKACRISPKAILIEDESEIPEDFFNLRTVGLTAGASTPDTVIDRVEEVLNRGYK